jgi:hypothetical protein
MSKELVISANRHEIKLGILEDDQLVEVFFQRANEYSLAGSIHKGRVTRVLPGMQSAFVDLGLERDTFLYVSDFADDAEDFDRVSVAREPSGREQSTREPQRGGRGSAPDRAPAAEVSQPALTDAEPVVGSAAAEAAPVSGPPERNERQDRGEDGDRGGRGRRSRRRRNRGRGFPDSKYASEVSRPSRMADPSTPVETASVAPFAHTPASSSVASSVTAPASSGPTDFSVLPGESLAKYTRSSIQPLDDAEEEEIRDLQETAVESELEAPVEIVEVAEEVEEEPDDAPIAEDTVALLDPVAEPESEMEATDVVVEVEMEMGPAEEADEAVSEVENQSDVSYGESASGTDSQVAAGAEQPPSGSAPLSAQVREQGGRYMHRLPRLPLKHPQAVLSSVPSPEHIPVRSELHCPPSPSFSRKARRLSFKSPRSPWDKRVRASLRISLYRDVMWCTCRRWNTPAFRARLRATTSACA